MRVSIIMPVYNGEIYLSEAIDSILRQTFTDWEFIIINEFGSNEKATEILHKYAQKDNRIVIVQNIKRLGISASMNIGIDKAQGEYIARMDGDDISLPERIEKQVAFMDANLDVGMCGVKIHEFGTREINWSIETDKDQLATDILFYSPCVHPTVMFRKDILDKYDLRYNDSFSASEDYELFSRISAVSKIANLDEILFKYRIIESNTTFKVNNMGIPLYSQVITAQLEKMGINFSAEEIDLLSPHISLKGTHGDDVCKKLMKLDLLLKKIFVANDVKKFYNKRTLSHTLYKRFREACQSVEWLCMDFDADKVKMIYGSSLFSNKYFHAGYRLPVDFAPTVTVLMPTYNSEAYVAEAVMSVLKQDYDNFEFLIVNEFGSNDDTVRILNMFEDERIRIIQNTQRLGLADSLNVGIKEAKGKYIARLDADDLCTVDRFSLQVEFMENNPDYGVCGGWQHHFGVNTDFIHKPPTTHDELKAHFMFRCELCHSTLMLRKSSFIDNKLFYDKNYAAEDYELWTRAIHMIKFANLPHILGEYRVGEGNITASKMEKLHYESGEIAARNISEHLHVNVPESHIKYFGNWYNEFNSIKNRSKYVSQMKIERKILTDIWNNNERLRVYDRTALLYVLNQRWLWINNSWRQGTVIENVVDIKTLLNDGVNLNASYVKARVIKKHIKECLKFILRPICRPVWRKISDRFDLLRQQMCDLDGHSWERKDELAEQIRGLQQTVDVLTVQAGQIQELQQTVDALAAQIKQFQNNSSQTLDSRIWKAEENLSKKIDVQYEILDKLDTEYTERNYQRNLIPYKDNEKIRIVFLFQIASFWPSWESFYEECIKNDNFEVKMVLLNDVVVETVQTQTARAFLKDKKIPFTDFEELNIDIYKPHIIVYQTPFDMWHRKYQNWSRNIKAKGIRIIYIPYGIEIGDTANARHEQFNHDIIINAWRVFTLSEKMLEEYKKYSSTPNAVRAVGTPKFDSLFYKEKYQLPNDSHLKVGGRKICLWKVHFPNRIEIHDKKVQITPYLKEYLVFAEKLEEFQDIFFIFMPHPKFREMCQWIDGATEEADELFNVINRSENVSVFTDDDYRPALVNADFVITDRSAIMVEAGALDVPVLYVYNYDYQEPMTQAIVPLMESYYHGTNCADMVSFLDMCRQGKDDKRKERTTAFHECVPYYDGNCGKRIARCIIQDIKREENSNQKTSKL